MKRPDEPGYVIDAGAGLTIGLILGGLLTLAVGMLANCGDDKWQLISHCSTGQAQHVNDELICYRNDGSAFKFVPWQDGYEDPATACGVCGGVPQ